MTGFARKQMVSPPGVTPARFGLLSAASVVTDDDPHWRNGVKMMPDSCAAASSYADGCPEVEDRTKDVTSGISVPGADPFTVYGGFHCAPVGFTEQEIRERATAALALGENRAIEEVFLTGDTTNGEVVFPFLQNADAAVLDRGFDIPAVVDTGDGATFRHALGLVEQALAECYGGQGVIHVAPKWAAFMAEAGISRNGETLVTLLGHKVAVGGGYSGDTIYGTGAVQAHRSAPNVVGPFPSTLNRTNNDVLFLVERTYAITWDCCLVSAGIVEV